MAGNRKILIVDHEPKAAVDMSRVLRSAGYEVLEAGTGKECLLQARTNSPHLILIDEALSDISGVDLLKQIKRDAELSRAYVAVLSREGTAPAIQARALESGADALILRGSQTRDFLARVEALVRRQASEDTLRTSLQDYRATFDAMSDAVYLVNNEYTITDCNLAMARFLARPRGEIVGSRCFELVHGTAKPIPACLGHRVRETRRRETLVVPMEDRWLQVGVDPLLDAGGAVIGSVHVLRDITEQRRTEEALQQAQNELDLSAAEHHLALDKASKDLQNEVDARLRTQKVLLGTQADLELRGRELEETARARSTAEESLQRLQHELRTIAAQASDLVYTWDVQSGRTQLVSDVRNRFSGQAGEFPATVGELQGLIHPRDRARAVKDLAEHIKAGTPWNREYRVVHHDGQVAHWAVSAAPLGETQEWMAVVRDVTESRRAETEQGELTAQLHQAQKMDALRRLAAGVADEFNQLLASILGQVELLLARIEPSHPLYNDLQGIARMVRQGVGLIRQLLAFAGRQAVQPDVLDVNAVIKDLQPELQRTLGKGIELQLALAAQLKPVYADARVLQDICLNLAARAAATLTGGGVLRLHTAGVALTDSYIHTRPLARQGDYVRLTLAASAGSVLAEAEREGLFELKLAAPEAGAGAGLNLGVVYGLVRQLGGFVEVAQSAEETVWEVYLPAHPPQDTVEEPERVVAQEQVDEPPAAPEPEPPVAGPEPVESADTAPPPPAALEAEVTPPELPQEPAVEIAEQPATDEQQPSVAEAAVAEEAVADAPVEPPAPEQVAAVPEWLGEPVVQENITDTPPVPAGAEQPPPGDIMESDPQQRSTLSGLRSRLRRLRRKRDEK